MNHETGSRHLSEVACRMAAAGLFRRRGDQRTDVVAQDAARVFCAENGQNPAGPILFGRMMCSAL